jgi:hypothetical protein
MGYYMGDGSAARHQGGLFSGLGKLVRGVARVASNFIPGPVGMLAKFAAGAIGGAPGGLVQTLAAQFTPSTIPGVTAMSSSAPLAAPVSTSHQVRQKTTRTQTRRGKTLRRRSTSNRRTMNAATRARLRRLGYRL